MAADWLGISSDEYDSHCGDDGVHKIDEVLDGTDYWGHQVDETHWLILDLGQTYTIEKIRGRSNSVRDPIDIDVYISDSKEDWGSAVASNITDWQDSSDWNEIDITNKNGRYVKIVINDTENESNYLYFGKSGFPPFITIFDVYGDIYTPPVNEYTTFITPVGNQIGWTWTSGQYNTDIGMRATSSNPTVWEWADISSSTSYFYPSGSPTRWKWISGSTA